MARYEHLPIYKQALDVAVHFEKVVAGFSRYHKYTLGSELRAKSREVVALGATVSSYLGHFRQANSWHLWQSLWARYVFLAQYFDFDAEQWKLMRKYPVPPGLRVVCQQYRYFRWRFPEDVLLFRVGRFFEFYDIGETPQLACLGLKKMGWTRRGARHGFPANHLKRNLERLLSQGSTVLLIGEKDSSTGGVRSRYPLCRFVPVE